VIEAYQHQLRRRQQVTIKTAITRTHRGRQRPIVAQSQPTLARNVCTHNPGYPLARSGAHTGPDWFTLWYQLVM